MPELTLKLILFLVSVGLFTLIAAVSDLRSRRIPNKLTFPMFLLGLVFQTVFAGWGGLADAGLGFLVGFGTLFLLWLVGGGGGGDVKLMGALSVWLGFRATLWVMILSTAIVLVGTVLSVIWTLMSRGLSGTKRRYMAKSDDDEDKKRSSRGETIQERKQRRIMAYAVPVALATWAVVILRLPLMAG